MIDKKSDSDIFEVLLQENQDESLDEWIHFVSRTTPDYMYEHWQNMYETQNNYNEVE